MVISCIAMCMFARLKISVIGSRKLRPRVEANDCGRVYTVYPVRLKGRPGNINNAMPMALGPLC
jgi:hypothetical protein